MFFECFFKDFPPIVSIDFKIDSHTQAKSLNHIDRELFFCGFG